jgi:chemotaxis signal transduction protein
MQSSLSPSPADTSARAFLKVRAGEYLCALPLGRVRRVVQALAVRPLPGSADELLGLAEFSGEPLAVIDLARLVDAPAGATPDYPVTIVAWAGPDSDRELIGLAADAALEVVTIASEDVVPGRGGAVVGEVAVAGEAVRVVDLAALGDG